MTTTPPNTNLTIAPQSPRRQITLAVAVATTLGIGGITAGAQLASASAPGGDITDAAQPADESTPAEIDVSQGTIDGEAVSIIDADLEAAFADYDACLAEQLPDLFGDDATMWNEVELDDFDIDDADWEIADNISVLVTGQDGEPDWTTLDLGDGDSTITINKIDGEVTVSADGDVVEVSLDDMQFDDMELDADWQAENDAFEAADAACNDALPDMSQFDELFTDDLGIVVEEAAAD